MITSNYLVLGNRLNRLIDDVWGSTYHNGGASWTPAIDVVEGDGETRISAEIPGVKPEDIKVSVERSVLSIEGQKAGYAFKRAFTLPSTLDAEGIKARYEHGVLTVTLPQAENAKARQIAVESVR